MMLSNQIPTRPAPLSQDTDGPETFREREILLNSNAACPEAKDTTELMPHELDHYAVPPYVQCFAQQTELYTQLCLELVDQRLTQRIP